MQHSASSALLIPARPDLPSPAISARSTVPGFRTNPDFDLSPDQQTAEWGRMCSAPMPLERPVLVLGGYHSPSFTARAVASRLCRLTGGERAPILPVAYPFSCNVESAARRVLAAACAAFPAATPERTREFDVVAISMGGLVARLAAAGRATGWPRLSVQRLFTIATPHRGAKIARVVAVDRAAREMRPGSAFLRQLDRDSADATYELVCYGQLRDWWVGARHTAPPAREPIWLDTRGLLAYALSHFTILYNRTILIDLARRLRGEAPIAGPGSRPPAD